MDVSSVTSLPVSTTNRQSSGGSADFVSSSPAASSAVVKTAGSPASNTESSPSSDRIAQAIDRVNNAFAQHAKNLHGTMDKDKVSGVMVFKIVDRQTNDVIRQLPPREVVAFARFLEQPQGLRGLFVQEKG